MIHDLSESKWVAEKSATLFFQIERSENCSLNRVKNVAKNSIFLMKHINKSTERSLIMVMNYVFLFIIGLISGAVIGLLIRVIMMMVNEHKARNVRQYQPYRYSNTVDPVDIIGRIIEEKIQNNEVIKIEQLDDK